MKKKNAPQQTSQQPTPGFETGSGALIKQLEQSLQETTRALEAANEALRQREVIFKNLLENTPDALVGVNQLGNIILVNGRAETLFGYSHDEMLGRHVSMLMPEEFREHHGSPIEDMTWNSHSRVMGAGQPLLGLRKDGTTFPVDINLSTMETDTGLVMLSTIRDVTERRQAFEALREREKLLTTAAMAAPVVFFKVDKDGIIQFSLGQSLARRLENIESVGRSIYDIYGKYPQVINAYRRALSGETVTTVIEAAGLYYEATYAPMHDERGQITSVVGVASDLTRHRHVEEALRQSEAHFRAIFDYAILGIKVLNLEGQIIDSNPALQEMLGYTAEELQYKTFMDLTHPADSPAFQKALDQLRTGQTDHIRIEKRYLHKSGQVIWGKLAMSLVRMPDGTPQYCIGMIENISGQRETEAELAELQRRLADGAENERLHLSQELHDGPLQDLQAISYHVAYLESYVQDGEMKEEIEELQGDVRKVAQALRAICGELRPPSLAPFGLEKAIRSHADQIKEQRPEINLHLDLITDGKQLSERVRLALFRIYQNSMTNILRHANAKNVRVIFYFDDDQIELRVEDDGQGFAVPQRWIELVREGHYGLVGSIERAESVGGKLSIQSNLGKGTQVCVVVPRKEEDQVAPKERLTTRILGF